MGLAFWTTFGETDTSYWQELEYVNSAPAFTGISEFFVYYYEDDVLKLGAAMPDYPGDTEGGILVHSDRTRGLRMRNAGPSAVTCTIYRFEGGEWMEDSQTVVPNDDTLTTQRTANYEFPIRVEITP